MLIDFESMLAKGFVMGNAEMYSPKSIQTATAQVSQILANVASSQFGGCSFDRMDEVLAPYAELNYQKHLTDAGTYSIPNKEKYAVEKTNKDIYDSIQALEHEINTLFSSNGQTPFVTVGLGLSTDRWGREIQKAVFNVRLAGLGDGRTAIFPKILFTVKKGTNFSKEDPNYDIKRLALKCTAERIYPDVLNYEKIIDITGSFKASMGCRSFLQQWINPETGLEEHAGRQNMGVVTLNLPRIAIESEGDKGVFWDILSERAEIVKDALIFRINRVLETQPENAPILYKYGSTGAWLNDGDSIKGLIKNKRATASIGYIGLYEVGVLMFGKDWQQDHYVDPEAKTFLKQVLQYLKDRALEWSDEQDVWFSVYGTPSESLTDRFCRMDTEKFGIIPRVTDKGFYVNSFHYSEELKPTPFEKIDFETEFQPLSSGGFISYVEAPSLVNNLDAMEALWDYSYDKLGYFGVNSPIDKCFDCGFEGDFTPTVDGYECPQCRNNDPRTCDVIKRQCGLKIA